MHCWILVHYWLRADKVKQLVEAEDEAKFYEVLSETPYGRQEEFRREERRTSSFCRIRC